MGPIPVQLNAVDASGNSQSATVAFTLDTTPPPVPVFDLSKTDQTGAPGSHQTQSQTVTLVGQTGASDAVTLESNGQTIANTTANTTGAFEFDNVSLTQGNNPLTVQAIDAASNTSTYSVTIQLQTANSTNPVLAWNATALQAIATDADAPTVASRALAMESLAVYDVISAINGMLGYLVNVTAPADASADAAVAEAADTVLDNLYPAQAANFDAQLAAELAAIPAGQALTDGIALGQEVAQDIIALRANDGSSDTVIGSPWRRTASRTTAPWPPARSLPAPSPPKPASRSLPFRIPWTAAPRCRSISTRPAVRSIRRWICRSLAPTATP